MEKMANKASEIPLEPVAHSSHVAATGYDEDTLSMVVEYLDGSFYCWKEIPASAYTAMRAAPSVGKYLRTMEKQFGKGIRMK
jgi:hypothetical protein